MIPSFDKQLGKKIRVFISSTFRDMNEERSLIVNSIFPRLRRRFSKDMIDITEVDLRWGISEDDSENGRILEICIGEVLRCSPFFVGMIGDNYGTVAAKEDIENLPPAYLGALGEGSLDGISITELEMRAGVFVPNNKDFSCFFLKETGNEQSDGCRALKEGIRTGYSFSSYTDMSELEQSMYSTLERYIEKLLPERENPPYGDGDYLAHLKILKDNTAAYVADNLKVAKLESAINLRRNLFISGEKGMGKSALLSWLAKREGVERDGDVFFHFGAAGDSALKVSCIYGRLYKFLSSRYGVSVDCADPYERVVAALKEARIDKRLTLYFDTVEQYDDVAASYKLLSLSAHNSKIRIVLAGTEPPVGASCATEKLSPLSDEQVRQIVIGALRRCGKRLDAEKVQSIIETENCKNPLFLSVLLSQLRMYGSYETLGDFLDRLLVAGGFGELFSTVVERMRAYYKERSFNEENIYEALALLVYSRDGLPESAIQDIVGFIPVSRSVFMTAIELFLTEQDGLTKFSHDLFKAAAEAELKKKNRDYSAYASESIIKHLEKGHTSPMAKRELAYRYSVEKRSDELAALIKDAETFGLLLETDYYALAGYLSMLTKRQDELFESFLSNISDEEGRIRISELLCEAGCYDAAIKCVDACRSDNGTYLLRLKAVKARCIYKIGANRFSDAVKAYEELRALCNDMYPDDEVVRAKYSYLLGVAYNSAGRQADAQEVFRECAEALIGSGDESYTSAWVLDLYGSACYKRGELAEALGYSERAMEICRGLYGPVSGELAWSLCYGWPSVYALGQKKRALEMVGSAYEMYKQIFKGYGPRIAWASQNTGTALMISGELDSAEELYLFSINENDKAVSEERRPHVYSLTSYASLASLEYKRKNKEKADELATFALNESIAKNGKEHIYTANFYLTKGIVASDPEAIREAVRIYSLTSGAPDYYFAKVCLARILAKSDRIEEAKSVSSELMQEYFSEYRETELITYLVAETLEKITGEHRDEDELLFRYADYGYYLTHSNNSHIVFIPLI